MWWGMRLLVTGGTGVLGRAMRPLAEAAGHELAMPARDELDLFDPSAVADAVRDVDGILHLATRIRPVEQLSDPDAWRENDRLRADASRILIDAAIAAGVSVYVQPTVTFVYPTTGPVSEDTPVGEVSPLLRSALAAEEQTERFARAGGRGVVLRLGLLDGPGTGEYPPLADSAPRCTSPMPGARSCRRSRCRAASTTSAVTGSVSRPSASPGLPAGTRNSENRDMTADLQSRCDLLRSLQRPGDPLLLPNAWDVATARAVVAAGFPVVATTSGGVAAALGYEDHEGAPADEMLAAAARIARGVEVPVTVDAEAGYGMEPAELVAALRNAGAAGCNLEETDYAAGTLRDPDRHAEWLAAVRRAASEDGYPLVINARVDVFLAGFLAGADPGTQDELVPEALRRATAYLEAGADCVYPIALWEADALRRFMSEFGGLVNVTRLPQAPSLAELAALGVARVSWATLLYREAMARFEDQLASLD